MSKHYTETPDPAFVPTEPGFLVHGDCGRQWFVPMEAVGRDYAEFLRQADGLSEEEAQAAVARSQDFLDTWFAEQCNYWVDVERLGRLVVRSGRFKTKAALDRCRQRYPTRYAEYRLGEDGQVTLQRQRD